MRASTMVAKKDGEARPRSVRIQDEDWSKVQAYATATGRNIGVVAERLFQWFAEQSLDEKEAIMLWALDRDEQD